MDEAVNLQKSIQLAFASMEVFEGQPCLSRSSDLEVESINRLLARQTWRSVVVSFPGDWEKIDPHGLVAMISDDALVFFLPALILIGFEGSWRSKAVLDALLFRLRDLDKRNRLGALAITEAQMKSLFSALRYLFRGDPVSTHTLDKVIKGTVF